MMTGDFCPAMDLLQQSARNVILILFFKDFDYRI
jgi:hypothetical protein